MLTLLFLVAVPVVDRGPFANGARYDLTSATAQVVGMTETSTIGVVPQRGAQMAPPVAVPSPFAGMVVSWKEVRSPLAASR